MVLVKLLSQIGGPFDFIVSQSLNLLHTFESQSISNFISILNSWTFWLDYYIETLQDSRIHDAHDIIGYMLLVVVLIVKMTN